MYSRLQNPSNAKAGDVAARTVGYLNDWADGKYKEGEKLLPVIMYGMTNQHNCTDCHGANVPKFGR